MIQSWKRIRNSGYLSSFLTKLTLILFTTSSST